MSKKYDAQSIGRFIPTKKGIVYIDDAGTAWTEKNVGDIIRLFKGHIATITGLSHYKKMLEK
jgi:hypothetical protein